MGIRFNCPNGHKLNVKDFLAGRKGICPFCGEKIQIPLQSTRPSSKQEQEEDLDNPKAGSSPVGYNIEPAEEAKQPLSPAPDIRSVAPSVKGGSPAVLERKIGTAPNDPLAEEGEVVWYVRPSSGGQYGPATSDIMRAWLAEDRIGADSLVWREGWRDWQTAADVFPQLSPSQSIPGLALETGVPNLVVSPDHAPSVLPRRPHRRAQAPGKKIIVIGSLVFAVVVLSIIFIVVLMNQK
jgi:hypothetical protein